MSNVIDFLERLGGDSSLRHAPLARVERAMLDAQMSPQLRAAVASGDQRVLEKLLGATPNVCCTVHAPLREDEEDDEQKQKKAVRAA